MKISNARYLLLVVAIAASAMPAWAVPAPAPPIDEWIAQLGDSDAGKRDKARRILQGLGEPVLAKVRQAAKEHPDPAVRKLAEEVAACIDRGEILSISTGNTSYWLNRVAFTPDDRRILVTGGALIEMDLIEAKEMRRDLELPFAPGFGPLP